MSSYMIQRRSFSALWVMPIVLGLIACNQQKEPPMGAQKPVVKVVQLKASPLTLTTDLPGRTVPYRVAEVRPQVSGLIQKRLFVEGGEVKASEPLYQIDSALYQATYNNQQAILSGAQAQYKTLNTLVQRYAPLVATKAISQQTYDDAVAQRDAARAQVLSATAALETAKINLVYTKVLSPISGIVGRSSVTEGALVTANQANVLATVQQIDPIYVDVTQSSTQILALQKALSKGQLRAPSEAPVTLT